MSLPRLDHENFDADRRHWISVRVYYEDTDFTGMVYHANYLRFFERGRSDYLRDAGVSHEGLLRREDPLAFTLTDARISFRKPARIDDLLSIRTCYLGMQGPRIGFRQCCLRGEEILADAEITAVMIHPDGRPRRPPRDIRARLESYRWRREDGIEA